MQEQHALGVEQDPPASLGAQYGHDDQERHGQHHRGRELQDPEQTGDLLPLHQAYEGEQLHGGRNDIGTVGVVHEYALGDRLFPVDQRYAHEQKGVHDKDDNQLFHQYRLLSASKLHPITDRVTAPK